jgi:hypothetical protein
VNANSGPQQKGRLSEPTGEVLDRIDDAHWNGCKGEGIVMSAYRHNACNHTLSGEIEVDGDRYSFVIDSGDWGGTVVHEWCSPDEAKGFREPEPPEPYTFVPNAPNLLENRPALFKVYGMWRKEAWFKDLERGYNYDRHFAPGTKTESHYREKAQKRGLCPGLLSNFNEEEMRVLRELGAT